MREMWHEDLVSLFDWDERLVTVGAGVTVQAAPADPARVILAFSGPSTIGMFASLRATAVESTGIQLLTTGWHRLTHRDDGVLVQLEWFLRHTDVGAQTVSVWQAWIRRRPGDRRSR